MYSGESIKVFMRVRPPDPLLESELDRSACLDVSSQESITVHCKPEPKVFTFDHVAGMETSQVSWDGGGLHLWANYPLFMLYCTRECV